MQVLSGGGRNDPYAQYAGIMQAVFLVEHSKAGRVVGPKGANIQHVKLQSGSANVRIEKEIRVSPLIQSFVQYLWHSSISIFTFLLPIQAMAGVQLRRLIVEGIPQSIKRFFSALASCFFSLPYSPDSTIFSLLFFRST